MAERKFGGLTIAEIRKQHNKDFGSIAISDLLDEVERLRAALETSSDRIGCGCGMHGVCNLCREADKLIETALAGKEATP